MNRFVILIPMFFLTLSSCLENDLPNPPVEVRFQLTNTSGEPTTVFHEGEDILFDYFIVNLTDKTVVWYFDSLFNYPKLFTVYKEVPPSPERPDGGILEIGTPHTSMLQRDARLGRGVPAEGEMRILMSWLGERENTYMFDNWFIYYHELEPLARGKYFVEFQQGITFAQYEAFYGEFRIDFEVD